MKSIYISSRVLKKGDLAINTSTKHVFTVNPSDEKTIRLGRKNGKKNVSTVMCCKCKRKKATKDLNGTSSFMCSTCYEKNKVFI